MNTSIVTMKNRGTSPNAIRSVNTFFAINTSNSNHKERNHLNLLSKQKKVAMKKEMTKMIVKTKKITIFIKKHERKKRQGILVI